MALQIEGVHSRGAISTAATVSGLQISSSSSTSSSSTEASHTSAVLCLCGTHALARWGWRTWEFAVALILIKLFPDSLLLVSIFGLLDNIVRLLFGSVIGQFVDRKERLEGALTCYGIQNVCIGTSAAAAAVLTLLDTGKDGSLQPSHTVWTWILTVIVLLAGASSSIGSLGAAVAVEREYAKTLCGHDSAALRKLNSGLRAIDLLSQMLGPVAAGLLMSYGSMLTAIVVLSVYSLCAWLPEACLLRAAHRHSHRLRLPKPLAACAQPGRPNGLQVLLGASGWRLYFQQSTLLPGLALALLYFTVLSLGFLMTSFLAWQGMSEATISLFRAAGALSGLMATVVFPALQRCGVGLVGAGVLGVSWQLSCLVAGVAPVVIAQALAGSQADRPAPSATAPGFVDSGHAGTLPLHLLYVLLLGLVLSRFGLWLFDLAVSQLQQELVPETELGAVSGVQASLQSAFEILSFVAGAVVSRPQWFHWLMTGSCGAVLAAAVLYGGYAAQHVRSRQSGRQLAMDCHWQP